MNKSSILGVAILVPTLFACGRFEDQSAQNDKRVIDATMVAMQDGTMVDRDCLRGVAKAVETQGRGAAAGCIQGNARNMTDKNGRGFHNDTVYPDWWNYYYVYPPYYYGNYNNNNFCSYYGFSYNYNCYANFFGFDFNNYYSYYNNCDSCLYAPNYSRCITRCYRNNGWVGSL